MEFIAAAWPALACFVIMLALSIHTFLIARRHQADFITVAARMIRSVPHHWRMLTDRTYRRKFRCIERYERTLLDLVNAVSARNLLAAVADDALAEAYGTKTPERTEWLRRRLEKGMAEEFDKAKKAMAALLAALTDEDIGILAAYLKDEWYEGRVGPEPVADWLRRERELMAVSPYMAANHLMRAPRPASPLHPAGE